MIKYSLKTKMSLSYIAMSLLIISIISLFSNIILKQNFDKYIMKQIEKKSSEVIISIENNYDVVEHTWNINSISNIGMNALENGLVIKIRDNDDILWDATTHNNGLCIEMLNTMKNNMESTYRNFNGEYTEKEYTLKNNSNIVGYISIGYYGPFYFTENDLVFINELNKILIEIGIWSIIIAFIIGLLMSKKISDPITMVINKTKQIEKGNYKNKIEIKSNTIEIKDMINTLNNLGLELEKQENMRDRLTTDISHELRTPITILKGNIESMIDGVIQVDVNSLKMCYEELERLTNLIKMIENLNRLEYENMKLNFSYFNLDEQIRNIVDEFKSEIIRNNIIISLNLNLASNKIFADKDKLKQVIVNLMSNAIKYSYKDCRIEIITMLEQRKQIFIIKDTGRGIPEKDLPNIFDRFYRVDKSRNRENEGIGIGLAIVKSIIVAHGATIEVKSKVGEGTEFKIIFSM